MGGRKWGGQAARKERRRAGQPSSEQEDVVRSGTYGPPPRLKLDRLFDVESARLHGEHAVELAASKS